MVDNSVIDIPDCALDFDVLPIPGTSDLALFTSSLDSSSVYREDRELSPVPLGEGHSYIPWGGNNLMPFKIVDLIERDETMSTCMAFNAEVTAAAGMRYLPKDGSTRSMSAVESFEEDVDIDAVWSGQCIDICQFAFSVVELTLSVTPRDCSVKSMRRLEAAYCRLSPVDDKGHQWLYYANWRNAIPSLEYCNAVMPVIFSSSPLATLMSMIEDATLPPGTRKVAFWCALPTVDATYYPIPSYASLFRSGWYDIKQVISRAKLSKLKNSGTLKYHVQIDARYWARLIESERISDPALQRQRVIKAKQQIIDFLSGSNNSGKTIFSEVFVSPDGKSTPAVSISKIDDSKEGGDWATDIQEAVNMICFAMRTHSNLVGSVPGKSQSNNSGSDKRELYTIAQALKHPWRKILFAPHRLVCRLNGWPVRPHCDIMQLTTLDEHRDMKAVSTDQ